MQHVQKELQSAQWWKNNFYKYSIVRMELTGVLGLDRWFPNFFYLPMFGGSENLGHDPSPAAATDGSIRKTLFKKLLSLMHTQE